MAHAPTIVSRKLAFLTAQTRLLTTPDPLPTRSFTRANAASENPLPQRAIDDALGRLAHIVRQHARRVYAPQAARHVAEQVEGLYWEEAGRVTDGVGGDGIGREVDLSMCFLSNNTDPPHLYSLAAKPRYLCEALLTNPSGRGRDTPAPANLALREGSRRAPHGIPPLRSTSHAPVRTVGRTSSAARARGKAEEDEGGVAAVRDLA